MYMDFKAKAKEIHEYLRERGVNRVNKRDLQVMFIIGHSEAPVVWRAMQLFGWVTHWRELEWTGIQNEQV